MERFFKVWHISFCLLKTVVSSAALLTIQVSFFVQNIDQFFTYEKYNWCKEYIFCRNKWYISKEKCLSVYLAQDIHEFFKVSCHLQTLAVFLTLFVWISTLCAVGEGGIMIDSWLHLAKLLDLVFIQDSKTHAKPTTQFFC